MITKWVRLGLAHVARYQCLEHHLSSLLAWTKLLNHGLYTYIYTYIYIYIYMYIFKDSPSFFF